MLEQRKLIELEVKRGYWLYAGEVRETVMIQKLNYDVYYEVEKDSFFDLSDGNPQLNEEGFTYLVVWPDAGFEYPPGSWSAPPDARVFSLEGAISYAEDIVQQLIEWIT